MRSLVQSAIAPVTGADSDYDGLMHAIGDSDIVLIGEASHGTHEFYRERMRITTRLVEEKGFTAVAIEGDWPDAACADRYVRGMSDAGPDALADTAAGALEGFHRFPSWMWRNSDVVGSLQWLRAHNDSVGVPERKVGFYGLDLYSLRASMSAVVEYLEDVDPRAADAARRRYACFDQIGVAEPNRAGQEYGYAVAGGLLDPCEPEVVAQLRELHAQRSAYLSADGYEAESEFFDAARNAALVHNAEQYYRLMYRGGVASWNLRDSHMVDTLASLREFMSERVAQPKVVVWAHNSHVGDARATELGSGGQYNIGQLARERWPGQTFSVGMTTRAGTVTAASDWGGQVQRMNVRPAQEGSFEHALSEWAVPALVGITGSMPLGPNGLVAPGEIALERAIGVVYRPQTERASHWFHVDLHAQFDAVVHIDTTTAVVPLDRTEVWDRGEPPETFPTGL